nr:hypothetical protein [Anaerolineae bacterium]
MVKVQQGNGRTETIEETLAAFTDWLMGDFRKGQVVVASYDPELYGLEEIVLRLFWAFASEETDRAKFRQPPEH